MFILCLSTPKKFSETIMKNLLVGIKTNFKGHTFMCEWMVFKPIHAIFICTYLQRLN